MRFKVFLSLSICWSGLLLPGAGGQEEEFRESLYFSQLDRDRRTPQAVRVCGVLFVSAMGGPGVTMEDQVRSTYIRLQSVLGGYGLSMDDVAQERIYLRAGEDFSSVDAARLLVYTAAKAPASTRVAVAGFAEGGQRVAIELIAVASPEEE